MSQRTENSPSTRTASAASAEPAMPATPRVSGFRVLSVPGGRAGRIAVHIVTVLALVGLVAAGFADWAGVALFALVLGGLTAMRFLQLPAELQAGTGLAAQGAAWAAVLRLYEQIWWLDIVAHVALNGLLAGAAAVALLRARMTSSRTHRAGRWGVVITTTGAGAVLAIVWEIAEWLGHVYVDQSIHIPPGDTVGDLAAGVLGSMAAGLLLAFRGSVARTERWR